MAALRTEAVVSLTGTNGCSSGNTDALKQLN